MTLEDGSERVRGRAWAGAYPPFQLPTMLSSPNEKVGNSENNETDYFNRRFFNYLQVVAQGPPFGLAAFLPTIPHVIEPQR